MQFTKLNSSFLSGVDLIGHFLILTLELFSNRLFSMKSLRGTRLLSSIDFLNSKLVQKLKEMTPERIRQYFSHQSVHTKSLVAKSILKLKHGMNLKLGQRDCNNS